MLGLKQEEQGIIQLTIKKFDFFQIGNFSCFEIQVLNQIENFNILYFHQKIEINNFFHVFYLILKCPIDKKLKLVYVYIYIILKKGWEILN